MSTVGVVQPLWQLGYPLLESKFTMNFYYKSADLYTLYELKQARTDSVRTSWGEPK